MKYVFQKSKIWQAGDPIDPDSEPVTVKVQPGKGEEAARRRLPESGLGRKWILLRTE